MVFVYNNYTKYQVLRTQEEVAQPNIQLSPSMTKPLPNLDELDCMGETKKCIEKLTNNISD